MLARGGTALSGFRPWDADEEATIRRLYPGDIAATCAALPHRTRHSILRKAQTMGVHNLTCRRTPWSKEEDQRLRTLWALGLSLRRISDRMGRNQQGIAKHVERLGLPLGVPRGYESITESCKRVGFHGCTMWTILRWAAVVTTAVRAKKPQGKFRRYYVDPFDVDEAVKKWLSTETIAGAATSRDIPRSTLRKWLLCAGAFTSSADARKHQRIPTKVIDRVVAERRAQKEGA